MLSLRLILSLIALSGAVAAGDAPLRASQGSLFAPSSAKSLGALTVAAGQTITFDTGSASAAPSVSGAVTGAGQLGVTHGGKTQTAVFAFDSIAIAQGATVRITGDRALVLLSKGTASIDAALDVSGTAGSDSRRPAGEGGPGAEGGQRGTSVNSFPPPSDAGNGSFGNERDGIPGRGFGAGYNERCRGGGGYGGKGGSASEGSKLLRLERQGVILTATGGPVYGSDAFLDLWGGSDGAGAANDRNNDVAAGGGGGGAIAIIATTQLTIGASGRILARGGNGGSHLACGGGGSGGGIVLAAETVTIANGAQVDASGGAGGSSSGDISVISPKGRRNAASGGGGGGGRIAIFSKADLGGAGKNKLDAKTPAGVVLAGGKGGKGAQDGDDGLFYDGSWPGLR